MFIVISEIVYAERTSSAQTEQFAASLLLFRLADVTVDQRGVSWLSTWMEQTNEPVYIQE